MKKQKRKTTSHIAHFIMTIIFFPWIVIWIICAINTHEENKKIENRYR